MENHTHELADKCIKTQRLHDKNIILLQGTDFKDHYYQQQNRTRLNIKDSY